MSDRPLRWAILGTGGMPLAARLRGQRRHPRDRRQPRPRPARAAAAEFGAERGGSYEDVLAAADVDVIYNALPNQLHVEWTVLVA